MGDRHERARRAAIRVLSVVRLSRRRRAPHHTLLVIALSLLGTLSLSGGAEAFDRYQTYTRDLPDPSSLSTKELSQATKIYDRNGTLLYVKHTEGVIRTVEPLSQISPHLVQATIAVEDRGFYTHHGVDFKRIVAATIANLTHQRIEQGASTITEQFVNGSMQRDVKAPWFVDYVLQVLTQRYGADVVKGGGLRVTTTLDLGLQQTAENAVHTEVNQPSLKARNVNNGAAEVIDPSTGQVLAMVGSADYYNVGIGGQFNVITGGLGRQPGSSFKIYDYATAFSNRYTPATLINDTQGKIDGHAFVDWDHRSEGLITLRQALAESRNIPAILLLKNLG